MPPTLDDDRLSFSHVLTRAVGGGRPSGIRLNGVVELRLDPAGVHGERRPVRGEGLVGDDGAVEGRDGRHALDDELVQGAPGPLDGLGAVTAGDNELGYHRVERAGDGVALGEAGVPAHPGTVRDDHARDGAGCGQEAAAASSPLIRNSIECACGSRSVKVSGSPPRS